MRWECFSICEGSELPRLWFRPVCNIVPSVPHNNLGGDRLPWGGNCWAGSFKVLTTFPWIHGECYIAKDESHLFLAFRSHQHFSRELQVGLKQPGSQGWLFRQVVGVRDLLGKIRIIFLKWVFLPNSACVRHWETSPCSRWESGPRNAKLNKDQMKVRIENCTKFQLLPSPHSTTDEGSLRFYRNRSPNLVVLPPQNQTLHRLWLLQQFHWRSFDLSASTHGHTSKHHRGDCKWRAGNPHTTL